MRGLKNIVSGLILGIAAFGVAAAAPASAPVKAPVAAEADCQKTGGEVSAIIDKNKTSPNIAAARAAFQVGIMECMDGDDATANKHYDDVKKLLSNEAPKTPAIRVPTAG